LAISEIWGLIKEENAFPEFIENFPGGCSYAWIAGIYPAG
jgi:hypothetical protein